DVWNNLVDQASEPGPGLVLAVDVSPDRSMASIGVASERRDGVVHLEIIENRAGTGWLVPRLREIRERHGAAVVVMDALSAAASLEPDMRRAGLRVIKTSLSDLADACGLFFDAVQDGAVRHLGSPVLDAALRSARRRKLRSGEAWAWSRATSEADITPLVSVTLALWGVKSAKVPSGGRSARKVLVMYLEAVALFVPNILSDRLDALESEALRRMVERLAAKRPRHRVRAHYYDAQHQLRDLRVALPPALVHAIEPVLGWPAKAVDALERRTRLEGFTLPGGSASDYGIDEIWRENRLEVEAPMIHTSTLIHSVSFVAVSAGDASLGEPAAVVSTYDATQATGLWRPSSRDLGAALLVSKWDDEGECRFFVVFPHRVFEAWREKNGPWQVRESVNPYGRVPVEPIVYRPRISRPFGSSRISRPIMSITDSAMRTMARAEVNAEFFSAPQRYCLGAAESMLVGANGEDKSSWDLLIGRLLAVPDGDLGAADRVEVGQFPQINMQPHTDQMRMWAQLFQAESGIAAESLGVGGSQSNPSSAEAIYAGEKDLVIEAEATCAGFGPSWERVAQWAAMVANGDTTLPDGLRALSARWRDPSTPSRAAAVDA